MWYTCRTMVHTDLIVDKRFRWISEDVLKDSQDLFMTLRTIHARWCYLLLFIIYFLNWTTQILSLPQCHSCILIYYAALLSHRHYHVTFVQSGGRTWSEVNRRWFADIRVLRVLLQQDGRTFYLSKSGKIHMTVFDIIWRLPWSSSFFAYQNSKW